MNKKEEYKEFLKYIFNDYVKPRIEKADLYYYEKKYQLKHKQFLLKRAICILECLYKYNKNEEDIYTTFKITGIKKAVEDIENGVDLNYKLAEETGYLEALDLYYNEIVAGLDKDLFPKEEYELMREIGFKNPNSDLMRIIYMIKTKKRNGNKISEELKKTKEIISKKFNCIDDSIAENKLNNKPHKTNRLFKGLGKIGQGAALSISDIALAIGALKFPVSPETQTWGSFVSVIAGFGNIFDGVGEIRGE